MAIDYIWSAPLEVLQAETEPECGILYIKIMVIVGFVFTYLDFAFHSLGHEQVLRHVGHSFANIVSSQDAEESLFVLLAQIFSVF